MRRASALNRPLGTFARQLVAASGVVLLLASLPAAAHAQIPGQAEPSGLDTAGQTGGGITSFGLMDWLNLGLRLALVVVIIWAAVAGLRWYTRRLHGGAMPGRQLQIVETRALGPNRTLHLVRLGGHAVLVGVTAERINALLQIDDADEVERLTAASAEAPPPRSIRSLVSGMTGLLAVRLTRYTQRFGQRLATRGLATGALATGALATGALATGARGRTAPRETSPLPGDIHGVSEYEQVEALGGYRGVRLSDLERALGDPGRPEERAAW